MPDISQTLTESLTVPVVTIKPPTALRALTGGQRQVCVTGNNIREVLAGLDRDFPGVLEQIIDQAASVRRYVNVYRNDDDIRTLDGLETKVENHDVIWIIPAVAGGSGLWP